MLLSRDFLRLPQIKSLLAGYNLGQNKWKTWIPPPPQIKDGKMARFCPSCGFILDLGGGGEGMGVCCSILFCPRLYLQQECYIRKRLASEPTNPRAQSRLVSFSLCNCKLVLLPYNTTNVCKILQLCGTISSLPVYVLPLNLLCKFTNFKALFPAV